MAIANSDGSIMLSVAVDKETFEKSLKGVEISGKKLNNTFSKIGTTVAKSFTLAATAAATGIGVMVKKSVDAYGEYEQLVGGVETLFKGAAQKVIDYADDAFYTAGVSANEYMQQVTSFSASLISSCAGDTDKAADIANMALIDISDNANKMGSSMESVTLAYQGFAKQQYMLLDNLKLGYGGTKTEMQRLLKDAQAITGVKYDIDNLADVYNALHVIQEQLGITGTTAKEAEETIQGSANMMKASWENVIAAISGGGDIDKAINNLVYSITKYFDNIVPVVQRALVGVGQLIEKVAPMLVQNVASALIQAIPNLLNAVYQMIIGLAKGIWEGIKAILSGKSGGNSEITAQIKTTASGAGTIADSLGTAANNQDALTDSVKETNKELKKTLAGFDDLQILTDNSASDGSAETATVPSIGGGSEISVNIPEIGEVEGADTTVWDNLLQILNEIKDVFLSGFWEAFINADFSGITKSIDGIRASLISIATSPEITTAMQSVGTSLAYALGQVAGSVASVGTTIATSLVSGFNQYLTSNTPFIQQSLAKIFDAGSYVFASVGNLWSAFANTFSVFADENGTALAGNVIGIFSNIFLGLTTLATEFAADFVNFLIQPIVDNQDQIKTVLDGILGTFADSTATVKKYYDDLVADIISLYETHISPLIQTITDVISSVVNTFLNVWQKYMQPVLDEISTKFEDMVEKHIAPMFDKIFAFIGKCADLTKPYWENILKPLFNLITEVFVAEISAALSRLYSVVSTVISAISDAIGNIFDILSGLIDFIIGVFTGDFKKAFNGVKQAFSGVVNAITAILGGAINVIIEIINGFMKGINLAIGAINLIPGVEISKLKLLEKVEIPKLAQGAVIPANREFLAVLGDQKHGTNIEAPADLIKQIVNEALDERGVTGSQQQQVIKEEHYNLNQTELMRIVYKLVKGGERLNGTSLVKQGGI